MSYNVRGQHIERNEVCRIPSQCCTHRNPILQYTVHIARLMIMKIIDVIIRVMSLKTSMCQNKRYADYRDDPNHVVRMLRHYRLDQNKRFVSSMMLCACLFYNGIHHMKFAPRSSRVKGSTAQVSDDMSFCTARDPMYGVYLQIRCLTFASRFCARHIASTTKM